MESSRKDLLTAIQDNDVEKVKLILEQDANKKLLADGSLFKTAYHQYHGSAT